MLQKAIFISFLGVILLLLFSLVLAFTDHMGISQEVFNFVFGLLILGTIFYIFNLKNAKD
jgi:hypothetical protein